MAQVHVLSDPERRRRWSEEQKRTIVAAAFAPGAVVADVARRADVCSSLIYRWRREMGAPIGFAEVIVDRRGGERGGELGNRLGPPVVERLGSGAADGPAIEIELSGSSWVRIPASVPAALAAAVITALARR